MFMKQLFFVENIIFFALKNGGFSPILSESNTTKITFFSCCSRTLLIKFIEFENMPIFISSSLTQIAISTLTPKVAPVSSNKRIYFWTEIVA